MTDEGVAISAECADYLAGLFKAMADPVRLRLLSIVLSHKDGEACVCELTNAFGLSQPTVSYHLKVLHQAGLVARERRGTWVYYRAVPEAIAEVAALVGGMDRVGTG
ncbi:hypothetical protein GCM10022243_15920 [Saccharothrix violaceirubra]|uniref:ArsR family transcriptional regulator n=1 Tax=Saccharothrix violaceirubra TaxID=413306 RepID=A0A7W7T6H8_9PSEU|nr:metalloregulator ArsR/SmtB family transcription factor [Saccharothrix violaceirubra]MBB4967469.1 ArsR family transcriptional regulator [Saccharothrix violaceirubra]